MAIDDLLDEHEQGERVRAWLRRNALGLLAGIAIGLGAIFGFQWWERQQAATASGAYAAYNDTQAALAGSDLAKAQADVAALTKRDDGVYADLAALRLAKAQVEAGKSADAIATLKAIKPDAGLKTVVDQRLARLQIDAGKPADAIATLGASTEATSLEIRGDALLAQDKRADAQASYLKALTAIDVAAPQHKLVELKLAAAGGKVPTPAEAG